MLKKTISKSLDERGVLDIFDAFYDDIKDKKQGGNCSTMLTPHIQRKVKVSRDADGFDATIRKTKWNSKVYNALALKSGTKLTTAFHEMIEDLFSLNAESVSCIIADGDGKGDYGNLKIKPSFSFTGPRTIGFARYDTTITARCPLKGEGKLNAMLCQ